MKKYLILVLAMLGNMYAGAQVSPQVVADLTVKFKKKEEKVLYYAFESGDEVRFSFEAQKKGKAASIEILEYPKVQKYTSLDVAAVKSYSLKIPKRGIYEFKIKGRAKKMLAKVKIERIPASRNTEHFNTGVIWVDRWDTVNVLKKRKVWVENNPNAPRQMKLERVDTNLVMVVDRTERVHSYFAIGKSNIANIQFMLPQNTQRNDGDKETKTELLSWVCLIDASNKNDDKWQEEANKEARKLVKTGVGIAAKLATGPYAAVALLAIEGISAFRRPPVGENVKYDLASYLYDEYSLLSSGECVASVIRVDEVRQGEIGLVLGNDNLIDGINVKVEVHALVATYHYSIAQKDGTWQRKKVLVREARKRRVPVMMQDLS